MKGLEGVCFHLEVNTCESFGNSNLIFFVRRSVPTLAEFPQNFALLRISGCFYFSKNDNFKAILSGFLPFFSYFGGVCG